MVSDPPLLCDHCLAPTDSLHRFWIDYNRCICHHCLVWAPVSWHAFGASDSFEFSRILSQIGVLDSGIPPLRNGSFIPDLWKEKLWAESYLLEPRERVG